MSDDDESVNQDELAAAMARSRRGDESQGDKMVPQARRSGNEVAAASSQSDKDKSDESKKKKSKVLIPLPPQLAMFRFEHCSNVVHAQEVDKNNKQNPSATQVAKHITCRGDWKNLTSDQKKWIDNNKCADHTICWDLAKLRSEQIRQLTFDFGVKKRGSASSCTCRLAMARHSVVEQVHKNNNIINPNSSPQERKTNTMMRAINALFASEFKADFLKFDDAKKRKDFEAASGGNPIKNFHNDVAECCNDPANDSTLLTVLHSEEDEDQPLHDLVQNDGVNLSDFDQMNGDAIAQVSCQD